MISKNSLASSCEAFRCSFFGSPKLNVKKAFLDDFLTTMDTGYLSVVFTCSFEFFPCGFNYWDTWRTLVLASSLLRPTPASDSTPEKINEFTSARQAVATFQYLGLG